MTVLVTKMYIFVHKNALHSSKTYDRIGLSSIDKKITIK